MAHFQACRGYVLLILAAHCLPAPVAAQHTTRPEGPSPIHRPTEASRLLAQAKVDYDSGRAVDETLAVKMLVLNCRDVPLADTYRAQELFCGSVLAPALRAAANGTDLNAEKLRSLLKRQDELLGQAGVPESMVAAHRIYLSQYQFGLPDKAPLRATLDDVGDAMTSHLVWPGLRGMYWNLRGLVASEDAQFAFALDCHGRALALREEANLAEDRAASLNNLGYLMFRMGDHAAAADLLREACDWYAKIRAKFGTLETEGELLARMNLAKAREGSQEFEAALEQYEALVAVAQRFPEPLRSRFDFQFRNNAAVTHYSLGSFAACERELTASRVTAIGELGAKALHVAEIDINLGWVALTTGRRELAVERFKSAVMNLKANYRTHHRYAEALGYLARAKAATGAAEEARGLLEEALRLREQQMEATLGSALSQRDRLAYVQQLRVHPDSLSWPGALDTFLELAPQLSISAKEQYSRVLRWKGAVSWHDATIQPASEETRALEAERALVRMRLLGLADAARRKDPDATSELARLEREANNLDRNLRALRQPPAQPRTSASPAEVAAALPADAALVDLIEVRRHQARSDGERVGNDRAYVAFVVHAEGDVRRVELGQMGRSSHIDSAAAQFRERIEKRGTFESAARRLSELVGNPVRQAMNDAKQVIISADGAVQHIPWSALPGLQKNYWVQEVTVTTVPSAAALIARRRPAEVSTGNRWLAVGGVEYGVGSGNKSKWVALKNTKTEAVNVDRRLAAVFGPSADAMTLLTGADASKQRIRDLLGARRWVHLATHGEFQQRRTEAFGLHDALAPLDSVLVLAGANSDLTGGAQSLLTAEELAALDLSRVELMVLSACQTGLGHVQAGQGQIGLVGALSKAGVGAVVASLWKVDDDATASLMEQFYAHALKSGERVSISSALRQAQLDLVEKPEQQHPYFWAAWGVTGLPDLSLGDQPQRE